MTLPPALSGFVLLRCEGGYPETFINTAAAASIPLWDIRYDQASLFCRAAAADYRRLRPAARRAHVRMRVQRKYGLPFRLKRSGLRLGIAAGLVLFFVVLQLLTSRVWVLRIEGNATVSDEAILSVLEPLGVAEGASFAAVDIPTLQLTALQQLPELTWLTVNQSGSIVTIHVKERTEAAPPASHVPANLVAACDGVIVSVDTAAGQSAVKPGDAVRQGDLLISGVMDSKVGPQLKHAAGSVIARTAHTITVTVPLIEAVTVPSATVVQPRLFAFGLSVPLYTSGSLPGEPLAAFEKRPVVAGGVPLPLGLSLTRYTYTTEEQRRHTPDQARRLAEERLSAAEEELTAFLTIESRTPHVSNTETAVTITVEYVGTREIAVEAAIR